MKTQTTIPKLGVVRSTLFSAGAIYLFSNILAAAIPFVLLPILTRYLSPAEYGQVAIYQTLLAGMSALIGISAQGAASVKYYDSHLSKHDLKIFIGNCFLVLIATSIFIFVGFLIFEDMLTKWLAIEAKWLFVSILISSSMFVIAMRMAQWQIRKKAKSYGLFQVSQSICNIGLSLLLVVYFLQGAAGRILALSVIPVVFALFALFFLHKDGLLGFRRRPAYLKEILGFGVPLIPHSVGLFLLGSIDRFFINEKLGLAQVGIYMVAVQLVACMGLVFDAINNAYVPWLFERLKRGQLEEKKQIVRWTYAYFAILIGVVGLVFYIGPPLLIFIAGKEYRAAAEILGWLAVGQAFQGMYLMVTNYVFYSKRTGLLSISTIAAGLINVILLTVLIDYLGLTGASVAFATSMALKFIMTWYVANLRHPMPWFNFNRGPDYAK